MPNSGYSTCSWRSDGQDGSVKESKDQAQNKVSTVLFLLVVASLQLLTGLVTYRDYDQVRQDIQSPKHLAQYKATKDTEDLPGLGRHYCVECAKWFESEYNLLAHTKGKNHKRRLVEQLWSSTSVFHRQKALTGNVYFDRIRLLREQPHTQKVAEAAVGLGTDNGPRAEQSVEMQG